MRFVSRASALIAATALALGCTGGQSGTETPEMMAGRGGGTPATPAVAGGEGGREAAGSGGDGRDMAGTMATVPEPTNAGSGGKPAGIKQAGSGGTDAGFAPNASADGVCACSLAGRAALLRARLLALDACSVRAEIEEVLALPANFSAAIAAGDEIEARRSTGCGEVPSLAAGDTALIVYAPPASAGAGAAALVASWSDPLVFGQPAAGEPIALPRSEQEKLLEPATCASGFGAAAKGMPAAACQ